MISDEFAEKFDPSGKHRSFIELIKFIHDDLAKTFPDAKVAFSKEFISYYDKNIPRKADTFLTLRVSKPRIKIRIEKDFNDIKPEDIDDIITQINDFTVDIEGKETVKIFCE